LKDAAKAALEKQKAEELADAEKEKEAKRLADAALAKQELEDAKEKLALEKLALEQKADEAAKKLALEAEKDAEKKELAAKEKEEQKLADAEKAALEQKELEEQKDDILIIDQVGGINNRKHKINFSNYTRSPIVGASIPTKQSDTNNLPCALPPHKVNTLRDLNGLVGMSYVNSKCPNVSLALNYNRYLNIKEYTQKDLGIDILDINMKKGVTNKQFSQIFSILIILI